MKLFFLIIALSMPKIKRTLLQLLQPPETDSTLYILTLLLVARLQNSYNAPSVPQNVRDRGKGHLRAPVPTPFPYLGFPVPPAAVGKL